MRSDSAAARQDELGDLARQIASQIKNEGTSSRIPNVLRPTFARSSGIPRPDQAAAMNAIVKAADLIGARHEQLTVAERRAEAAEEMIAALRRTLQETEDRLRTALEAGQRERRRAEEVERRSGELMDRHQTMMAEASAQLEASDKRAELAEDYLTSLQTIIRERLGG